MRILMPLLALGLSTSAWAQSGTKPHNPYSSTRNRADLATMGRLQSCGINAVAEGSNFYDGLATDFYVVLSGPFRSATAAADELGRARLWHQWPDPDGAPAHRGALRAATRRTGEACPSLARPAHRAGSRPGRGPTLG